MISLQSSEQIIICSKDWTEIFVKQSVNEYNRTDKLTSVIFVHN